MKFLVLMTLFSVALSDGAQELTKSNFDDIALNGGKNSFVKFLAPW